jgi:dTDP-glucose 4,6-dehydratase
MNLLVTGGAGFIGSHFVLEHLRHAPKDRIVVLDKLTYAADRTFLDPVKDTIGFVEGDIADTDAVDRLVQGEKIDVIVNFSAETHVDRSIADPHPFIHTNITGVQSLIDVCRKNKGLKLLHISTDEVYGDLEDDEPPKKVEDPLCPSSPYSASKAAGDLLVIAAMRTYGIHACISRCTNNFGQHQAMEKLIPTVISHALKDELIPIYAKGENKRDWLFVTDHCSAIEKILATDWAFFDKKIGSGHIFNVSADSEQRNIDVAKMILNILKKPESLLSFIADRPGHDWRYALDSSAIRKLGWKPQVSFKEGLQKTIEWYTARLSKTA